MQTPCGGRPCNCGLRIIEKQGFVAERKGILHSITCCVRMVIERDRKSDNMELYESEIIELKEIYTTDLKKEIVSLQIQMAERSILVCMTMERLLALIMLIL